MRAALLLAAALPCLAQTYSQRGFLETRGTFFPQKAPNDRAHAIGESLFRYETSIPTLPGLSLNGAFDARVDTHHMVDRTGEVNYWDRGTQRPALSVRRASLLYNKGMLTVEAGKQFIRWGRADVLNPIDRFAPRDFLAVIDNEFLGVTALRTTVEARGTTVDAVWQPRFTPSRTPLLNQRWVVLPEEASRLRLQDAGAHIPGGSQFGLRLNHVGRGFEGSVSFYEGHNHLPLLEGGIDLTNATARVRRVYPQLRQYGFDLAVPLPWFTVKTEAGYYTTTRQGTDEYIIYVVQLERLAGEWSFTGGYAGEKITQRRNPTDFAPDRGLTSAFLSRAAYTIDANRSIAFESAIRENLDGVWVKFEYSQAIGEHWRITAGLTGIGGERTDFLGQYRRNSHAILAIRYSF